MSQQLMGGYAGRVITQRPSLLISMEGLQHARGTFDKDKAYDGGNTGYEDELREGTICGVITASGLWRPCPRTKLVGDQGSGNTFTVTDARAFVVGDVVTIGAVTGRTITAINYATNAITIDGAATDPASAAAFFAEDGSQYARGLLNEFLKLKDSDGTRRYTASGRIITAGGMIRDSVCLGDLTTIRAASNGLGQILFGSDYGEA